MRLYYFFIISFIIAGFGCKTNSESNEKLTSNDAITKVKQDSITETTITSTVDSVYQIEHQNDIKNDHQSRLNHNTFTQLLTKHTKDGKINYATLKSEQQQLKKYLNKLAEYPPDDSWSRNEQLAYWINLYNASTINLILENYPLTSIKNINNGNPWSLAFISVGDKKYTLDEIEKDIIHSLSNDPRVHFALNCSANSCAPIPNKAFESYSIDAQLENQTKSFINNATKVSANNEIEISKLFMWYKDDFNVDSLGMIHFLNKYLDSTIDADTKIKYSEYDWNLNQK